MLDIAMAKKIAAKNDVPWEFVWEQLAHETNGFTSDLTTYHNYGGVTTNTPNDTPQPDGSLWYRQYDSDEEFVEHYSWLLGRFGVAGARTREDYVNRLHENGYFTDDPANYLAGMQRHSTEGFTMASGLGDTRFNADGVSEEYLQAKLELERNPPEKESLTFFDALQHGFEDSGFGQAVMQRWASQDTVSNYEPNWKPSRADIDYLDSVFKGDFITERRIVDTATSHAHMLALIAYEQERQKREEQAMNTDFFSVGGAGILLGSLVNPVNFIPVAGVGARAMRIASAGFTRKLMSATWTAAQLGAVNVADRYVGHKIGGIEYNPEAAFITGAALGGGAEMLGYFAGKGFRGIERVLDKVDQIQEVAALEANGIKVGRVADSFTKAIHEVDLMDALEAKGLDAAEALRALEVNQVDIMELANSFEAEGLDILDALNGIEKYSELEALGAEQAAKAVGDARVLRLLQNKDVLKTAKSLKLLKAKITETANISSVTEKALRGRQIEQNTLPPNLILQEGSWVKKVYDEGNLVFMSAKRAEKVLARMGQKMPEDATAFMSGGSNKIVVIKDRIKNFKELEGDVMHERIVHKGFNNLPKAVKDKFLKYIQKKIDNPKGLWNTAIAKARTTEPEEVFAHFVELGGLEQKDSMLNQVSRIFKDRMREIGMDIIDDAHVARILKEAAMKNVNTAKNGYILTSNGDAVINGIRFSRDMPLHPHIYDSYVQLTSEIEKQHNIDPWFRRIATNKWIGSDFGKTVLSASKTMARYGGELFRDTYQLGINDTLCAEHIKEQMVGRLQPYAISVLDARSEWLTKKDTLHNFPGYTSEQLARQFDETIFRYYDATYGSLVKKMEVDPEIIKAAGILKEMRDTIIDELKHSHDRLGITDGINILKETFQSLDEGLTRITDKIKMSEFINEAVFEGNIDNAVKYLSEYGYRAALRKMDANQKRYMSRHKIASIEEIDSVKFHELLRDEADKWAFGHIDTDASNIEGYLISDGTAVERKNPLSFLNDRFIADTSFEMPIPDGSGRMFSFDSNLRDFRLDNMIDRTINRTAGEIAFRRSFVDDADFIQQRAKMKSELELAAKGIKNPQTGEIETLSQTDIDDIMTTFDMMVSKLRGIPVSDRIANLGKGEINDIVGMLAKLTYTTSGNNIGISSVAEAIQSLQSNGMAVLPRVVESFTEGSTMNELKNLARTFELKDMHLYHKGRRFTSDDYVRRYGNNALGRGLDNINGGLNVASAITNLFNQLPRVTQEWTDILRASAWNDLIDGAHGREIQNFLYNPHEKAFLKEAGITTQEQLAKLNADIRKYLPEGQHIDPVKFEKWRKESPSTWWQFTKLGEDAAIRGLTRQTIGNSNTTFKSKALGRFASFFMNFTFMASHSQFLRTMNRPMKDKVLAGVFSIIGGGASYWTYTQAMAHTKYALDEKKREEYLSKKLDRKMLTLAMFSRGAFLAPMAYGQNAMEIMGLTPDTVRTTTGGNISKLRGDNIDSLGALARNFVNQMPIANQISNMGNSALNLAELAAFKASNGKYGSTMSQREVNQLVASMPFGNFFATQLVLEAMKQEMNIPRKELKGYSPLFK